MKRKVNVKQWLSPVFRIEVYKNGRWEWAQDADDWRSAIRKFNTLSALNPDERFRLIEVLATTSACDPHHMCPLKIRMLMKIDEPHLYNMERGY